MLFVHWETRRVIEIAKPLHLLSAPHLQQEPGEDSHAVERIDWERVVPDYPRHGPGWQIPIASSEHAPLSWLICKALYHLGDLIAHRCSLQLRVPWANIQDNDELSHKHVAYILVGMAHYYCQASLKAFEEFLYMWHIAVMTFSAHDTREFTTFSRTYVYIAGQKLDERGNSLDLWSISPMCRKQVWASFAFSIFVCWLIWEQFPRIFPNQKQWSELADWPAMPDRQTASMRSWESPLGACNLGQIPRRLKGLKAIIMVQWQLSGWGGWPIRWANRPALEAWIENILGMCFGAVKTISDWWSWNIAPCLQVVWKEK